MSKRGLVIMPVKVNYTESPLGGSLEIGNLDLRYIKTSALYWDEIVFSHMAAVRTEMEEVKDVIDQGIFKEIVVNDIKPELSAGGMADFCQGFLRAQERVCRDLNAENQDMWSLGQNDYKLTICSNPKMVYRPISYASHQCPYPIVVKNSKIDVDNKVIDGFLSDEHNLEITLNKSLPMLSADISFFDIFEFKEKRKDVLMEFRFTMDELLSDIKKSGQINRSKHAAIHRIDGVVGNVRRVVAERGWGGGTLIKSILRIPAKRLLSVIGAEDVVPYIFGEGRVEIYFKPEKYFPHMTHEMRNIAIALAHIEEAFPGTLPPIEPKPIPWTPQI